jgi:hypothetical protein
VKIHRLIGKIAGDKNSRKLGQVIGIKRLPKNITTAQSEPEGKLYDHLVIRVERFLRKDLGVPVAAEKILKVEGNYVWFDILKDEFNKMIEEGERVIDTSEVGAESIDKQGKWAHRHNYHYLFRYDDD